jgi:hypothetical protein
MTVQTSAHIYRSNAVMFAASIINFLHFFAEFFTFTVHCLLTSYNSVRLMGKFLSPNTFSNGFGFGGGNINWSAAFYVSLHGIQILTQYCNVVL